MIWISWSWTNSNAKDWCFNVSTWCTIQICYCFRILNRSMIYIHFIHTHKIYFTGIGKLFSVLWKKKNSIGPGVLKKSLAIGIGRPTDILLPRSCVIVNCHRFCIEKVLAKKANSWVRVNLKWSILMFSCCLLSDGCLAAWSTSR